MHELNANGANRGWSAQRRSALFLLVLGVPLLLLLAGIAALAFTNPGAAATCATTPGASINAMLLAAGFLGFVVAPTVQVAMGGGPRARSAAIITFCVTLALYGVVWAASNPCVALLFGR